MEVARLKDVIANVVSATEETMTCDVMYTSSHKALVSVCPPLTILTAL